jgi:hypothetical protein
LSFLLDLELDLVAGVMDGAQSPTEGASGGACGRERQGRSGSARWRTERNGQPPSRRLSLHKQEKGLEGWSRGCEQCRGVELGRFWSSFFCLEGIAGVALRASLINTPTRRRLAW